MKKSICIFLSLIMVLSTLTLNIFAIESDSSAPLSVEIYSEKQSYNKGEEIFVYASIKNTSLDEIKDMRVWMDYPQSDYYLTPGVTERFVEYLYESDVLKFRVVEDEGVLNFATKFDNTKLIKSFLLKLAHAYKNLTLAYATIRYGFQNAFASFRQENDELGTVKVLYDNTEIEFTLKCRYSVKKSKTNEAIKMSNDAGIASADIKAVKNSYTGLTFAMSESKDQFGLFAINPDLGKAYIYNVKDGKYNLLGSKTVNIKSDNFYNMKVLYDGNRVLCYITDNLYDTDSYPAFDFYYNSSETGYGVFCEQGGYENFTVTPSQIQEYDKTYTNPVYENAPDPYILKDGGTYYLSLIRHIQIVKSLKSFNII